MVQVAKITSLVVAAFQVCWQVSLQADLQLHSGLQEGEFMTDVACVAAYLQIDNQLAALYLKTGTSV